MVKWFRKRSDAILCDLCSELLEEADEQLCVLPEGCLEPGLVAALFVLFADTAAFGACDSMADVVAALGLRTPIEAATRGGGGGAAVEVHSDKAAKAPGAAASNSPTLQTSSVGDTQHGGHGAAVNGRADSTAQPVSDGDGGDSGVRDEGMSEDEHGSDDSEAEAQMTAVAVATAAALLPSAAADTLMAAIEQRLGRYQVDTDRDKQTWSATIVIETVCTLSIANGHVRLLKLDVSSLHVLAAGGRTW